MQKIYNDLEVQAVRTPLGLLTMRKREGEVGICYPNLRGVCLTLDGPKWVVPPCFCHKPAKNQQVKLVGKTAELTKNL